MALKHIRQVPTKLPMARLYLDDVADITEILLNASQKELARREDEMQFDDENRAAAWRQKNQSKVRYTFEKRESTTVADSIEDLKAAGGTATSFDIQVDYQNVSFSWYSEPRVHLSGIDAGEQRAVYQQIHAIFLNRQYQLSNAFRMLPSWIGFTFWISLWVVVPATDFLHLSRRWDIGLTSTLICGWLLVAAIYARAESGVLCRVSREIEVAFTSEKRIYSRSWFVNPWRCNNVFCGSPSEEIAVR
jgi:hypothetical protein